MPEQNQKFVYPIMIDFVDRRDKTKKSLGEGLTLDLTFFERQNSWVILRS